MTPLSLDPCPVPVKATPGAGPATSRPPDPSSDPAATSFADLVDAALDRRARPDTEESEPDQDGDAGPADTAATGTVQPLLASLMAAALGPTTAVPTSPPVTTNAPDGAETAVPGDLTATPAASVGALPDAPAGDAAAQGGAPTVPVPVSPGPAAGGPTPPTADEAGDASGAPPATPLGVPVTTSAPTSAPDATAPPGPAPAHRAVAAQVIPEITRLVTTGDGVHRVTLQLNPRALGEVRVVLTMRQGDVHVRLAAGTEARHALAETSIELARALEQVGIKDHRITLSQLGNGVSGTETRPETRSETRPGPDQGPRQDQGFAHTGAHTTGEDARHPRTGEQDQATDGTTPTIRSPRSRASESIPMVGAVPLAGGVDLRM